ncbi:MAG: glycosyltransferase family 39 protein [Chloroflexota bacterium]
MKTQRRRDRADYPPTPDHNENDSDVEEVVDGDIIDVEDAAANGLENGASSHLEEQDSTVSTNGSDNGHLNENGGNGSQVAPTRTVVPNLPRRRQRTESHALAPAVAEAPAPPTKASRQAAPVPTPPAATRVERAPTESFATKAFRLVVTYENLIYLGIFVLAIATRFWDVGNRGIHHDESLHSVYSRNLYIGNGYTHDPMMHGPLQFHLIAAMYWLFGTTDATARYASVFCGIFVVMSPFFLRRQMGRWPALIASFLLLVSPSILYFSRMAREDSIFSGMEMIMIVGLWRFVSTRRPADFFIFMAGLSLMFTIKESAYLTLAVLGIFFAGLFAVQAGFAILGAFVGYGAVMGAFYMFVNGKIKGGEIGKLPDIPVTSPDYNTIMNFVGALFGHPLVQGAIAITLLFIGVLTFLFLNQRRRVLRAEEYEVEEAPAVRRRPSRGTVVGSATAAPATGSSLPSRKSRGAVGDSVVASSNGYTDEVVVPVGNGVETGTEYVELDDMEATEVWNPKRLDPRPGSFLSHYEAGSIPHLLGSLFSRPSVLLIGFLIAAAIFTVFYTVFFTDVPRGIVSGLFASLGYWMAQQGVERGGQPWFYYMLLIPLYEPIAVFFSAAATIFFGVKGIRGLLRRREERYDTGEPGMGLFNIDRSVPFAKFSAFLPLFLIFWLAGVFFIYSWAGEKMPWLMVHMVRPAILLASLFLGALLASLLTRRQERLAAVDVEADNTYLPLAGVPSRRPASEAVVPAVPQKRRSGSEANIPPVPQRRRVVATPVLRTQDPPWVAWNQPGSRFPALSFLAGFVLLALAWGLKMNALTAKSDMPGWGVSWVFPALIVILVISYAVWLGPVRAFKYLALGIFSVFFLYQFRSAVNLAYNHPDVPIEMATYVQTSPDVTRSVAELNTYSDFATGGKNLKVVYDSFTSWPFEWYLRDFKNKQFIAGGDAPTGADVPILFLEYAKHNNDPKLADYVVQRYAMRWWFPEELYKSDFLPGQDPKTSPALSQIGGALNTVSLTVTDPSRSSSLWKYLVFRDLPKPLGSEDMVVAIRKDIVQQYHYLQYPPPVLDDTTVTVRAPGP